MARDCATHRGNPQTQCDHVSVEWTGRGIGGYDGRTGQIGSEEAGRARCRQVSARSATYILAKAEFSRILRQENYLIALFNKDLLDLRVRLPVPPTLIHLVPTRLLAPSTSPALPSHGQQSEKRYISFGKNTLTKALEWNLRFCLMGYLFDHRGQVRKEFVRERRRKDLVEG